MLLILAVAVSVASMTSISLFSSNALLVVSKNAASFIGADALIKSSTPISKDWLKLAYQGNIKTSEIVNFYSMAHTKNETQLINLIAFKENYPLSGKIHLLTQAKKQETRNQPPKQSTVWATENLLTLMKIDLGDTIKIGDENFIVDKIITSSPGQSSNWFNISPKVLMNSRDLEKTNVISPGSRVSYELLLSSSKKNISIFKKKVSLTAQQRWIDSDKSIPTVNKTIERSLNYFKLSIIITLMLGGTAIAIASFRFSKNQHKRIAVLKCLGLTSNTILKIYGGQIFTVAAIGSIIGVLVGIGFQPILLWLFHDYLSKSIPIKVEPILFCFSTGVLLIFSFIISYIWGFNKISPVEILRSQPQKLNNQIWRSILVGYLSIFLISYFFTQSWNLSIKVIISLLFISGFIISIVILFFNYFQSHSHKFPLWVRFGVNTIYRNNLNSSIHLIGVTLSLTAISTVLLLRFELVNDWKKMLPDKYANHFMVNIETHQVDSVRKLFSNKQVEVSSFYNIVRGRLISINGQTVTARLGDKAKEVRALQRELNLSSTNQIPQGNTVTSGIWAYKTSRLSWVSVEQGVAHRIGIKVGDVIEFIVSGESLRAKVNSFRKVDWVNFRPNFYFLFEPGSLNSYPQTALASFYLDPNKRKFTANLVESYPNITLIDVDDFINRVKIVTGDIINLISIISLFCLLLGLILSGLAVLSFSEQKKKEISVLKYLGLTQKQLLRTQFSESLLLGTTSGIVSMFISLAINSYLATMIFKVSLGIGVAWLLLLPVISTSLMVLISSLVYHYQYQNH
jgi:putative ABC transport system permease protein